MATAGRHRIGADVTAATLTGAGAHRGIRFGSAQRPTQPVCIGLSTDLTNAWCEIAFRSEAIALEKKRSERNAMIVWRNLACALACALSWLVAPAQAQESTPGPQHPGRSVVMSKCFQCHTDAMFRDQRQDRRGWEAAIYRMIGRGGLWTKEEITLMADYLGTDFGPNAKPATQTR